MYVHRIYPRLDCSRAAPASASTSEVPGFDSLFVRQEALLSQVPTPPTPSEDNTKPVEMPVAAPKGEPDQTNDEASSNPFLTPAPTPSCKKPRLKGAKKSTNGECDLTTSRSAADRNSQAPS
jgi:hypothetical protein